MSGASRIIVCAKQVPDPESPPSAFRVDGESLRVKLEGVPPVISTFDESALELAIRLKEEQGASVTLLSAGRGLSRAVILKAAAVGVDEVVLVEDDALDRERLDGIATASVLAAALRSIGEFDLLLTGRQAADTNAGQVGLLLACMLGVPGAGPAGSLQLHDGRAAIRRLLADGYEEVDLALPAVVTISHEVGELRYPALAAIKAAKSIPTRVFSLADLGLEPPFEAAIELVGLSLPSRERHCELIEADDPSEAGALLADRLVRDGVV